MEQNLTAMKTIILLPILFFFFLLQSCSPDALDDINDDSQQLPVELQQENHTLDQPH